MITRDLCDLITRNLRYLIITRDQSDTITITRDRSDMITHDRYDHHTRSEWSDNTRSKWSDHTWSGRASDFMHVLHLIVTASSGDDYILHSKYMCRLRQIPPAGGGGGAEPYMVGETIIQHARYQPAFRDISSRDILYMGRIPLLYSNYCINISPKSIFF